jgi:hypothetical protein
MGKNEPVTFHYIPLSADILKNSKLRISDLLRTGDSHPETFAFKSYVANKLIPDLEAPEFNDFKKMFGNRWRHTFNFVVGCGDVLGE